MRDEEEEIAKEAKTESKKKRRNWGIRNEIETCFFVKQFT